MTDRKLGFSTLQIHGGQEPDSATGSRAVPIYQTTSYCFDSVQYGADLFALKEEGHIYSRISFRGFRFQDIRHSRRHSNCKIGGIRSVKSVEKVIQSGMQISTSGSFPLPLSL